MEHAHSLGYSVEGCAPRELNRRVRLGDVPDVILLSTVDADPSLVLAGLRRSRRGASIPVLVYGPTDRSFGTLADILDLGGDGFLAEPFTREEFESAVGELAGAEPQTGRISAPSSRPPARSRGRHDGSDVPAFDDLPDPEDDEPGTTAREVTELIDDTDDHPSRGRRARPELGQLHATLDRLEARLRDRTPSPHDRAGDELDAFGLDEIPDVEPEGDPLDPADSGEYSLPPEPPSTERPSTLTDLRILRDAQAAANEDYPERPSERRASRGGERRHEPEPEHGRRVRGERGGRSLARPSPSRTDERPPATRGRARFERDAETMDEDFDRGEAYADRSYPPDYPSRSRVPAPEAYDPADPRERSAVTRPRRPERPAERPAERSAERPAERSAERRREYERERAPSPRPRSTRPAAAPASRESGRFSEKPYAELLWSLHERRASGRVTLRYNRAERELWLVDGELRFAASRAPSERLVDSLLRRGVLTRPQYETARRLAAKEPRRAGELLVDSGFIKARELDRVVRDHLGRLVEAGFGEHEGDWTFVAGERVDEPVELDRSMSKIILAGVRAKLEVPALRARLGGRVLMPALRTDGTDQPSLVDALEEELDLLPEEGDWLRAFDGRNGLDELLSVYDDELGLLALIYSLQLMGYIDLLGETPRREGSGRDEHQIDADRIVERLRIAREADYFELLGVGRDASRAEVRRVYDELSATFADSNLEAATQSRFAAELDELRSALEEARDILVDEAMRSAYLAHLDVSELSG